MNKYKYKLFGILFLISFLVLLIVSPDSYLCDHLVEHWDSAWFFTCGKAWMKGLVPYIDFADSKGPLLWLIYGIGYLISPKSYLGVFWLSVLLYTGVFYYVFKTAYIFLNSNKKSLTVVMAMVASYFCMFYYNETRAEDWCQIFLATSFYRICRLLYTSEGNSNHNIYITCFVIGIGLAGTMMIKYNITAMLGISATYVLYYLIREHKNILLSFISLLSGMATIIVPITIYMILAGNFSTFIQEYFVNTLFTLEQYNSSVQYVRELMYLFWDTHFFIIFSICVIGALMMSHIVEKDKWFFLISFFGFYFVAVHHSSTIVHYHLAICLFFPIWFCIAIIKKDYNSTKTYMVLSIVLLFTLIGNYNEFGYIKGNRWFKDSQMRQDRYTMAWYLAQITQPSIIYYKCSDIGLGVLSEALPGTRYWAEQAGATEEMLKEQKKAVEDGVADFIYTNNRVTPLAQNDSVVRAAGYTEIYHGILGKNDYKLYTKHHLSPPPKSIYINRFDILFRMDVMDK